MRILVVTPDYPWPARLGTHLRSQQVVSTLAALGDVDLFSLVYPGRPHPCEAPAEVVLRRQEVVARPAPAPALGRRLRWLVTPRRPLDLIGGSYASVRRRFAAWVDGPYDLVWVGRPGTFDLLGWPRLGRTVVDLDDLEDQKILARLRATPQTPSTGSVAARTRRRVAAVQARRNAACWASLQRRVARAVDTVVLAGADDVSRSGLGNAVLVPNGYTAPSRPVGRTEVGDPPVILFQGDMHYGPNTDGARWLVTEIAPLVRARRPEVRIRLVGDPDGVVTRLHHPPEVTVVGMVDSMEAELARADMVAAPLRYASGTRLKILEALAHRLPVVSTTVGAQGLGLESGRHLLLADDAEAFAGACLAVLGDEELRTTLADEGEAEFLRCHQWSNARERIRALVLGGALPPAPHGLVGRR